MRAGGVVRVAGCAGLCRFAVIPFARRLHRLFDDVLRRAAFFYCCHCLDGRAHRGLRRLRCFSRRGRSGRGNAPAFGVQLLELRADGLRDCRVGLRARTVVGELAGQYVLGLEERVDHVLAQHEFVVARTVEQRFEDVRRLRQRGKAERGCAALDRMRGTENRREVFGVGMRDVQIEQQLLHLREQFVRFVEERLIELSDVECHAWVTARVPV